MEFVNFLKLIWEKNVYATAFLRLRSVNILSFEGNVNK